MQFSAAKLNTLSEISRDVAQVLFAGLFVEPLARGSVDLVVTALGLIITLVAWGASIALRQE